MNLYDLVNPLTFAEAKASAKKSQDKDLYKTTKYADTRNAIDAARKEYPGANDVEALAAHSWKTDQLNQQQQQQIDQLQKQEKDLYKQIDATNKFVQDKERRFQDFTQKVAGMDLTPPEQARAAQDIERGEEPKVTQKPKDLFNPVTGTPKASTKPAQTRTAPTFIVPRTSSTAAEPQQTQQTAQEPTAQATQEPTASPALGQMANQLTQTPGRVVSPTQQLAQYQIPPATNWAANQPTVQPKPTTGAGKVKDLGTARQQKAASLLNLVGGQKVAEAVNPTPFVKQVADDNLQKFVNAYVANHDTVDIESPGSLIPIKIKRKQIKGVMDILSAMPNSETKKTLVLNLFGNPSYLLQFIHEYLTNKGAYVKPVSDPSQGELEEGGMKDLAIQGRAVPNAAGYHTVCKRVGADWVPIKSHESHDLAQRHAQAIKNKYPGMQIGVRDPANKYTMVGLEEDSWHGAGNDWSSEQDQWAHESADPVIALTGVDEDSSDFMANDSASPIGGNMKFENDDGDWYDDPDPTHHVVVKPQARVAANQPMKFPPELYDILARLPADQRADAIADWKRKHGVTEGYQDFKKVEPYAVCLAGKPVKQFDYYEQARQFHDNWKKKLYREGNKEKADKITLMPILDEAGSPAQQAAIAVAMKKAGKKPKQADEAYTPSPAKPFRNPRGFNKQGTGVGNKLADLNRKEWEEKKKKEQGVAEGAGKQLSVQQLATISDAALDSAYGYGRSQPGNTFGWQANLKSAAFAKQMIDKGITDVESISDAIHKGWNVTAQAFVKNPMMFDDSKTMAPEKLQAKVAQRQKLMTQQYAQLPEDEKEKDRVVARAMLQAITGGQQGVTEAVNPALANLTPDEIKGIGMMIQNGYDIPTIIRIFDNKPTAEQITAIAMANMQQSVAEGSEPEGSTFKNSLHTIIRVATHLEKQMGDSENFPEWESEMIGSVKDQMVKIMNYEISKKEQQGVAEAETDYSKRRQREKDVDAGKTVAKQRTSKMTDYQKRRAQQKREMELGENTNYWAKLQNERNTKLNSLVDELKESIKK